MNTGYVYIILNLEQWDKQVFRIGKTKNNTLSRLKSQISYLPFNSTFISFKLDDYQQAETDLHRLLKNTRLNGDWYDSDVAKVFDFLMNHYEILEYNLPSFNTLLRAKLGLKD